MAGEIVTFRSDSGEASGYLAAPREGRGPGVIVIQEWWGLVPHIKDVADRFAAEGFLALAPDLYHGKSARSPDEAGRLMMALNIDQAERDLSGAVSYLESHPSNAAGKVGSVGFCMGGALSLFAATRNRDLDACSRSGRADLLDLVWLKAEERDDAYRVGLRARLADRDWIEHHGFACGRGGGGRRGDEGTAGNSRHEASRTPGGLSYSVTRRGTMG